MELSPFFQENLEHHTTLFVPVYRKKFGTCIFMTYFCIYSVILLGLFFSLKTSFCF